MTDPINPNPTTTATSRGAGSPRRAPRGDGAASTRERILDVALELFVEQGYDKTSLRQISEKLGVTKAALYYHFRSKDEILFALHLRLHEFGEQALARLGEIPATPAAWSELMQSLVSGILAQRAIFMLHERNHAAIEQLQAMHDHGERHQDLEEALRAALSDRSIPAVHRLRLGASVGALFSGLLLSQVALGELSEDELAEMLRQVIADIFQPII